VRRMMLQWKIQKIRQLNLNWFPHRGKSKGKVVPLLNQLSTIPWRLMAVWMYVSTTIDLSTRWSASRPDRFSSGKSSAPIV
jgi:hypothetical protein